MKIGSTSILYKTVNLDHEDLNKMLVIIDYPDYLHPFRSLSVMIVCVKDEQHEHDAYVYQGKPYVSLVLDYDKVAGLPAEEVTLICKNELLLYLQLLDSLPVRELV